MDPVDVLHQGHQLLGTELTGIASELELGRIHRIRLDRDISLNLGISWHILLLMLLLLMLLLWLLLLVMLLMLLLLLMMLIRSRGRGDDDVWSCSSYERVSASVKVKVITSVLYLLSNLMPCCSSFSPGGNWMVENCACDIGTVPTICPRVLADAEDEGSGLGSGT